MSLHSSCTQVVDIVMIGFRIIYNTLRRNPNLKRVFLEVTSGY